MPIDFTQAITAEDKGAVAAEARAAAIRAETTRRIDAAARPHTRENMAAAAAAGLLDDADATAYRAAVLWVGAMRAACQRLIADRDADHAADAAWPDLPEGVAALVARF